MKYYIDRCILPYLTAFQRVMCVLRSLARSFTRLLALVTAQIHSKKALTSAYVQNKKKITARSSRRYSDQTTKISSGYTDAVHAACIAPYSRFNAKIISIASFTTCVGRLLPAGIGTNYGTSHYRPSAIGNLVITVYFSLPPI